MTVRPADFEFVARFVHDEVGLVLEPGKEYLVEARLDLVRRARRLESIEDVVAKLRSGSDPELGRLVVEALTTNETSFFRDVAPFEWMRTVELPSLLARSETAPIWIWCAACSFGQEPYSVALLLREHFADRALARVRIVGTDVSHSALERARKGEYSQVEVNRGLPATLLARYFSANARNYRLDDSIRKMVEFRELNLLGDYGPLVHFDIVLLRNVLIYFDPATRERVLEKVRLSLRMGGALLLGSTETGAQNAGGFERAMEGRAVYYRRSS